MNEKKFVCTTIKVIETNVDGCGTDIEMFVRVNGVMNEELTSDFADCLAASKKNHRGEEFSTEDYVDATIEQFNAMHPERKAKTVPAPYNLELSF